MYGDHWTTGGHVDVPSEVDGRTYGNLVVALYEGKRFVGFDSQKIKTDYNYVYGSVETDGNPDNFKIFVWDSLDGCNPCT